MVGLEEVEQAKVLQETQDFQAVAAVKDLMVAAARVVAEVLQVLLEAEVVMVETVW
jgi:hypothetical protein